MPLPWKGDSFDLKSSVESQLKVFLEMEVLVDAHSYLPCLAGRWVWRWHPSTALLRQAGLSGQGHYSPVLQYSPDSPWLEQACVSGCLVLPFLRLTCAQEARHSPCCLAETCGCTAETFLPPAQCHLSFLLLF